MRYRRSRVPGGCYFFTVVTHRRRPLFRNSEAVALLRGAFRHVMARRPFAIDAMVVLPDHLHCLWTLPLGDGDHSSRWRMVKSHFSRHWRASGDTQPCWQQRYWEHLIRDDRDFRLHADYIHYNPVKHGYVTRPWDWPGSSFRRAVANGEYPADWGAAGSPDVPEWIGSE